ncbi:MAG: hypothetical protein JNL70_18385 [Saprospiraceae bacterium]|nr:hypothetical protein [Saprospiraceae bacterium]
MAKSKSKFINWLIPKDDSDYQANKNGIKNSFYISWFSFLGWSMIIIGSFGLFYAYGKDESILTEYGNRIINFGLVNDKRNLLYLFGLALVVGVILVSVGSFKNNKIRAVVIEEEEDTKVCPYCAETIKKAAKICRFCDRDV